MGTINVTLGDATQLNLPLGRQLENEVTEVVFDFSAWKTTYGTGTLSLSVQRKGDEMPYPVTMTVSGTNATWEVTDTDTSRKGVGKAQLTYTVGDAVKKSVIYKFTVYESLGADGEYPAPGETWKDEMEADISSLQSQIGNLANLDTDDKSNLVAAINEAAQSGGSGSGITADIKAALLQIAQKVAYIDEDGQDYYDALYDALYPPVNLTSISCVYTQSGTVYDTDSLDSLKSDLVVTAHYSNGTSETITNYTLSGTLAVGTSTVTVTYGGKTDTFSVTVTHWEPITANITWTGSGADKTSSIFDATQYDAYYELPFVSGSAQIVEGSTAGTDAFRPYDTYLYSDAEGTTLVGRYQSDTGEIGQAGRAAASCPVYAFDNKIKVAPRGYYAKLVLNKYTAFASNGNFMTYIQANGNKITLE